MRTFALVLLVVLLPIFTIAENANEYVFQSNYETLENSSLIYNSNVSTMMEFRVGGIVMEPKELGDGSYMKPEMLCPDPERFGSLAEEGMPDLPAYTENIIIPDQSGYRVNIISAEYEVVENVKVAPTQPFQLEGREDALPFAKDNGVYSRDEFYPGDIVSAGEPMIMRDFRFVQVAVNPVQYNPVKEEMRIYTHIQYELVYDGFDSRNQKQRQNNNISETFLPIYRAVFKNADEVLTDFDVVRGGMLIISPSNYNFADTVKATLARWKHLKGYNTYVAPTTEINPGGSPSYSEVYNYIENAYDTWAVPPDFVLLVGDEDMQIPDYPYSYYASDHQYSTVDGSDYISDVLIARMSVDNLSELRVAIKKVMRYETDPDMTEPAFWKRGLGVAGNIYATSPRITNLWVRRLAMEHGYTQVDTVFDWGSGAPNWSTIPQAINNGVSYISYRGWAGSSGWYNPSYTTSDIGQLTNGFKMGIMVSIVCGTGNFGSSTCFGEAWISYGSTTLPKGGPAFYGCSDGNTHTAWNNPNMVGFYWALFEQDMYHMAQLMFMGKQRISECFPRYTGDGDHVNKYYNTYNCLGDPSLEVRKEIPQTLAASYPSTIPVGQGSISVNVTSGGYPLAGAYVNLVKGWGSTEEAFVGDWTDGSGNVTLSFANTSADTIHITVTARDHIPHIGYCMSTSSAVSLGIDQLQTDDDNFGGTSGNSDGNANPGEEIGLDFLVRNFGDDQAATDVKMTLVPADPEVVIDNNEISFGNIIPGDAVKPQIQPIIRLGNNLAHGARIALNAFIQSNEGNWNLPLEVEIKSVKPAIMTTSFPENANSRLDPGEVNSQMILTFTNLGGLSGNYVTGRLSCEDDYISIVDGEASFGNIPVNQSGSNTADPFILSVDPGAMPGQNVNFRVAFTTSSGIEFERVFPVVLGAVDIDDPCGPDDYGYYMYDNTDTGYDPHPTYNWIELAPSLGTRLSMRDDDDCSEIVTLPFDFVYYGRAHRQIIVSTNGFIALDTIPYDVGGNYWHNWDNWPHPDQGNARGQISPFWDDLQYSGTTNGIYTYNDAGNGRFIIEWYGFNHATTGSAEQFQVIILDPSVHPTPTGDAEIIFQYHTINNNDNSSDPDGPGTYSSVGFENWEQTDGLSYEYDNTYHPSAATLQNGRAIKITTSTGSTLESPSLNQPADNNVSNDMTPSLSWYTVSSATRYHLQVDDNSNFGSPIYNDSTLTGLSYTFPTALPTGEYFWRVRCTDGSSWSGYSSYRRFVLSILETPVLVSPSSGGNVYIERPTFFWHQAPGATGYHFQIDDASDFTSPIYQISSLTDTSFTLSFDLTSGTYYWRIRATDGVIWSDYTSGSGFSTAAPNAPILSTPANGNNSSTDPPTFIWQAPTGGNAYDLQIDDNSDFGSPVLTYEGYSGTSITPVSQLGEGTYYWHVRAEGDFGYSSYSGAFNFTIDYGSVDYKYYPGDANMAAGIWPPAVIGGDVTYLVNFFRGLVSSCILDGFFASGDINADCRVIGSDVTALVNYFRGMGSINHCADYPPAWQSPADFPSSEPSGWPNCDQIVTDDQKDVKSSVK